MQLPVQFLDTLDVGRIV